MRVEVSGTGQPELVCIHGLADMHEIWSRLVADLRSLGRVVVFDQRAHGESTAPPGPYRREDLAMDVRHVLDDLAIARAVLIGHSLGGVVAMTAAVLYPERVAGLVLLGTASECSARASAWYEHIAGAAEADGLTGFAQAIFGTASTKPIRGDARGLAHVTRCLQSLHDDPLTPKLAALRCPVLLCVGEKDPMGSAASVIIQRHVDGAELAVIAGRGHWLHVEAPDTVADLITAFLVRRRLTVNEPTHPAAGAMSPRR